SFLQLFQVIIPFILEFIFLQQFYSVWIYTGIFLILVSTVWIGKGNNSSIEKRQDVSPSSMISKEIKESIC
ncbi:MAG: hypothetical protein ACW99F_20390, partial [Candidatus Hodarchaeales archaeon]